MEVSNPKEVGQENEVSPQLETGFKDVQCPGAASEFCHASIVEFTAYELNKWNQPYLRCSACSRPWYHR